MPRSAMLCRDLKVLDFRWQSVIDCGDSTSVPIVSRLAQNRPGFGVANCVAELARHGGRYMPFGRTRER